MSHGKLLFDVIFGLFAFGISASTMNLKKSVHACIYIHQKGKVLCTHLKTNGFQGFLLVEVMDLQVVGAIIRLV
jgi:hypothetical protein